MAQARDRVRWRAPWTCRSGRADGELRAPARRIARLLLARLGRLGRGGGARLGRLGGGGGAAALEPVLAEHVRGMTGVVKRLM